MQEYKTCKTCMQTLTIENFHRQLQRRVAHCKACVKIKSKQHYLENSELLREKARQYRAKNPEKVRERRLAWKRANKEKNVAMVVKYQRRNPDKRAAATKRYRERNKERYASWSRARQAKLNNCKHYLITDKDLRKLYSDPCFACGSREKQTIDHIIPIDLGGNHGIGNLQTLCLSCNSSKRNRVMTVWRKSLSKL